MKRYLHFALVGGLAGLFAACGGTIDYDPGTGGADGGAGDGGADAGADSGANTDTGTGADSGGLADSGGGTDSGSVDDTAEGGDTGIDPDADVGLECDEFERVIGGRCRSIYTRMCFGEIDCREGETCTYLANDTPTSGGHCLLDAVPDTVCPGSPSCPQRPDVELKAAFGAETITPSGYELVRPAWGENVNADGNPTSFVGDTRDPETFCDCGRDMICPPGPEFADCPSLGTWTAPDADGTERDGKMQGAWLAGFEFSRPAGWCPPEKVGDACVGNDCCVSRIAHDHLWIRGGVIEQGETRIAILTVDTVGFFYDDIAEIERRLDPALGIDKVVISATHTHEAPDTMGQWGPGVLGSDTPDESGVVPEWMDEIYGSAVRLISGAVARLEPVDVYASQTNTGSLGVALRDSRPPYIANDLLTTVRFVRAGAAPDDAAAGLGTFVNWHSHPEVLWSGNVYITSDFPHALRQTVEEGIAAATEGSGGGFPGAAGLGGVAVYTTGTCGGLLTPGSSGEVVDVRGQSFRGQDFDRAHALGERLGYSVIQAYGRPCAAGEQVGCYRRINDETLSFANRVFNTDIVNRVFHTAVFGLNLFRRGVYNWKFQDGYLGPRFPQVITAITQVRIGELTFQTLPGESFSETWMGGFDPDNSAKNPVLGDPGDVNCAADRVTRLEAGVEPRFGCFFEENAQNLPDLSQAPTGGYLYNTLPGSYIYAIGLGNDELGYIVPKYDFKVDANAPFMIEAQGDHYEETNSAGDRIELFLQHVSDLTGLLDAAR